MTPRGYVVDRIEGPVAVLVEEGSGATLDVPLALLPEAARPGSHLRFDREPGRSTLTLDPEGEAAARADVKALQERLRSKRPG